MTDCIVCETPNADIRPVGGATIFDCKRCGRFSLADSVVATIETDFKKEPLRRAIMSHTLRRAFRGQEEAKIITTYDLPSYWAAGRLPTPQQRADSFILWIGENQPAVTVQAISAELALDAWIGGALPKAPGAAAGLRWLLEQFNAAGEKLFQFGFGHGDIWLSLTLPGWNRFAELKHKTVTSRTGFMAMKFGDSVLDGVVRKHFKPAVEKTGFELKLLTDEQPAGLIDNQLRAAILSARFLIADLSHSNAGAYWEAGFADGLGLPVIYTCESTKWNKSKTHFDTNHMLTIVWDQKEAQKAADQLTATIRATLRAEAN